MSRRAGVEGAGPGRPSRRSPVTWMIGAAMSCAAVSGACSPATAADRYGQATIATPLDGDEAILRPYASGAGPTAIFRLGRRSDGTGDLFGIVDPVAWRIQFLTVDDWKGRDSAPLAQRIHWAGACRLPPNRRVWRVATWPDRVVLQLQPDPTIEEITAGAPLRFPKLVIPADSASVAALERPGPSLDIDDEAGGPGKTCGNAADDATLPVFGPGDAVTRTTGGGSLPFLVRRRPSAAATPFLRASLSIGPSATNPLTAGGVLTSIQELEDARSVNSGRQLRHFLLVARSDAAPGFARSAVVIVRRSEGGRLDGTMRIDTGLARVKTGQRLAAVSSKGEVLLIGAASKDAFWIRACHFTDVPKDTNLCSLLRSTPPEAPGTAAGATPGIQAPAAAFDPADEATEAPATPSQAAIWSRAAWYVSQRYRFDASTLPNRCRHAVQGCTVLGYANAWLPISTLRFAHGVVERRGVPYAQRQTTAGTPTPDSRTADLPAAADQDGIPTMPVFRESDGAAYVVSDINNEGLPTNDPTDLKLFGIDCSTFLARLWGIPPAPTNTVIDRAIGGTVRRLATFGALRQGDAMIINLKDGHDHPLINHVVIFRQRVRSGPTDNSRAIEVVESSSSCGGVCTSLYDESFFDGWALIGPGKPDPTMHMLPRIPKTYLEWVTLRAGASPP